MLVGPRGVVNIDFNIWEARSSADWMKIAKEINYEHGLRTNKVGMASNDDSIVQGEDEKMHKLKWNETEESMDVSLEIPKELTTVFTAKQVKVKFQARHLVVSVQNITSEERTIKGVTTLPNEWAILLDADLAGSIYIDECSWSLDRAKDDQSCRIEVSMAKSDDIMWGKLHK